jgi:hypothetical protein
MVTIDSVLGLQTTKTREKRNQAEKTPQLQSRAISTQWGLVCDGWRPLSLHAGRTSQDILNSIGDEPENYPLSDSVCDRISVIQASFQANLEGRSAERMRRILMILNWL